MSVNAIDSIFDYVKDTQIDEEVSTAIDEIAQETHVNELGYDSWGFCPKEAKFWASLFKNVYHYFRPVIEGLDQIPKGRVLFIANHSGQLPFDAIAIAFAVLLHGCPPRFLRIMAERWVPRLPFLNVLFSRCGVVLGDPINCRNLLEAEQGILVFPEGARGSGKIWQRRYQLVHFGRGFMRLALQTETPIIPVGVVGAEESIISIGNAKRIAKLIRAPYFPIPALLPVLGPLAFLPMPTRFYLQFGKPMIFEGPFDDEDEVINRKVSQVKDAVRDLIQQGLQKRKSWFK